MSAPEELLSQTLRSTLELERIGHARTVRALEEAERLLRNLLTAATSEALTSGNDREAAQADATLASAIEAARAHLKLPAPVTTQGGA